MVDELKKELIKLNEDRIYIENRIERTYNRIKKLLEKVGLDDEINYNSLYNISNENFQQIITEIGVIRIIQETIEEELEKMIQEKELK
ncbi:hypothetical protein [Campylobacter cuniculorum]|uniref:Uncharacterized protein n=2 Tax=Campylobacter cuniculorum TaxID=374106 RepID=A0A1W6BYE2_9BACT|nr:hypothetical protein [Campylobacter cuniculorum]ARJ57126.1 hypothetical protein CCUN_1543 [Campylobacter cuniculorum DSM 23162 = LMG 24588]QOR04570.1 hypothetical protein A0071_01055 [Campylobacter cuniculorum]